MRNFTVCEAEQRSTAWFAARVGRVTGSVAADFMAEAKKAGAELACRRDLRTKLALERIVGRSLEVDYQNADMKRGIELEPEARAAFEAATGEMVSTSGFLSHNDLMIGCSLDGHMGDFKVIVELKAPRAANHLKYIMARVLPAEHKFQIVHNMLVSGAAATEFCSYCPDFPEPLRLFRVRYERNDVEVKSYEIVLRAFLKTIEEEERQIRDLALVAA